MADEAYDKRLTPARPDLAAEHLRGRIKADRYAVGEPAQAVEYVSNLWSRRDLWSGIETQVLFCERLTVYERADGWAWVQLARDGYVGYVREAAIAPVGLPATHRVSALRAPLFSAADLKSQSVGFVPLNAQVAVKSVQGEYFQIESDFWLSEKHAVALDRHESDWVAVAERIIGAPYLWGGKTPDGLDCSGLIQAALHAAGMECPRDTDMQEKALGTKLLEGAELRRGDIVFWKGHVGVMRNETELLHANAHHMATAVEPVAEAIARIASKGTPVSSIKRLGVAAV
jgi:cell wall-associated NlpC family hydrolase